MKKAKIFYTIKKIMTLVLLFILGGIVYSFGVTIAENIKLNRVTKSFIKRGIYEEDKSFIHLEHNGITYRRDYYKVPRETYENDGKNVFRHDSEALGQRGDIFVTKQSPFPEIPVIHQFVTYYFGGHAAISDGNGYFYETYGIAAGDNMWDVIKHNGIDEHDFMVTVDKTNHNGWQELDLSGNYNYYYHDVYYRPEFYVLRVKDADDKVLDKVFDYLEDKIEHNLYNYLFFLDMNHKYYCTDLISRAYSYGLMDSTKNYARRLNDDGFITSVHDLILSKDTYIAAYVKIEKKDDVIIENYYYLEDIDN